METGEQDPNNHPLIPDGEKKHFRCIGRVVVVEVESHRGRLGGQGMRWEGRRSNLKRDRPKESTWHLRGNSKTNSAKGFYKIRVTTRGQKVRGGGELPFGFLQQRT